LGNFLWPGHNEQITLIDCNEKLPFPFYLTPDLDIKEHIDTSVIENKAKVLGWNSVHSLSHPHDTSICGLNDYF
jgi:hypothetical protein